MDAIPPETTFSQSTPPRRFDEARPWRTHYSPGVPHTIALPEHPLPWLLDEAVGKQPAATATEYDGATLTYRQLSSAANRFARSLLALGLHRGDRVALSLPNIP